MPLLPQFGGQLVRALAGPAQRRHRIAPGHRLDQRFQVRQQRRIPLAGGFAPPALTADALLLGGDGGRRLRQGRQIPPPVGNPLAGEAGGRGHPARATAPEGPGFHRGGPIVGSFELLLAHPIAQKLQPAIMEHALDDDAVMVENAGGVFQQVEEHLLGGVGGQGAGGLYVLRHHVHV